jgi:hypothetical protein
VIIKTLFAIPAGIAALCANCHAAEPPKPVWTITEKLGAPSHALYDPGSKTLFVSQISGEGDKKDGVGVVSRLDLNGQMLDSEWVSGLNAPKGLARSGSTLWVSDIDRLHQIDIEGVKATECYDIPNAKFLTGVTVDSAGVVYVADMLTSTIYSYDKGKIAVDLRGNALESPGGILRDGQRLIVAAWGLTTDYSTEAPGRFLAIDGRQPKALSKPLGNLYGIVSDGANGWIGSDFASGRVWHVTENAVPRELLHLSPGIAGIEYVPSKKLLIVPELTQNRISAYDVTTILKTNSR